MDKYKFGRENGFLKGGIYNYIETNKEEYGISNIEFGENDRNKEELYALTNRIKWDIECGSVENKMILAVLYKIKFDLKMTDKVKVEYNRGKNVNDGYDAKIECGSDIG